MTKFRSRHAALACLALFILTACTSIATDKNLDSLLIAEGTSPAQAALLIVRLEDGQRWSSGGKRLKTRFTPASTAKIPHTLIALETSAVSGPDDVFEWDGKLRRFTAWNETQDLQTAFKRSTVWIYQILTQRIGRAALSDWLSRFDYGNADIGPPDNITQYWLSGPLAISAEEQVAFLSRLARQDLPLSAETYAAAFPILIETSGAGSTLYAKTGRKSVPGETDIGWYVGWLEQAEGEAPGTYVFAYNMDMSDPVRDRARRRTVVYHALEAIGAWPP